MAYSYKAAGTGNSSGIKAPEPPSDALDHLGVDGGVGSARPWYASACAAVETSSGASSRRTRAILPLLSRAHAYQPGLELSRQGRGPVSLAETPEIRRRNPPSTPRAKNRGWRTRTRSWSANENKPDARRLAAANAILSETNEYSLAFNTFDGGVVRGILALVKFRA